MYIVKKEYVEELTKKGIVICSVSINGNDEITIQQPYKDCIFVDPKLNDIALDFEF